MGFNLRWSETAWQLLFSERSVLTGHAAEHGFQAQWQAGDLVLTKALERHQVSPYRPGLDVTEWLAGRAK